VFSSQRHCVPDRKRPQGQALRAANLSARVFADLDPASDPEKWALRGKRISMNTASEWNRGVEAPGYEKENPRPGYAVWETKTRDIRLRQLPTDQLSCGSDPRITE
jgi:hypothetical protein